MKNFLTLIPFMLASIAAVASVEVPADCKCEPAACDCEPLQVHRLSSAPIVKASEAKAHFDGRSAPAGAIATNSTGDVACNYQGNQVRWMQRGPIRRAVGWLFRRRRCASIQPSAAGLARTAPYVESPFALGFASHERGRLNGLSPDCHSIAVATFKASALQG